MNKRTTDYHKQVAEKIISMLEAGTPPWEMPWEDYRLPLNGVSKRRYRGINTLHLLCEMKEKNYNDPRWYTFQQAKEAGAKIKAGSKAVTVQYWKFDKKEKDEEGNEITVPLDHPVVFYANVFNAEQIEGLPPYQKTEHKWDPVERAEKIIAASNVPVIADSLSNNYYSPSRDEIHTTPRSSFKTAAGYYSTVLHEVGHSTGHASRLNRDMSGTFGTPSYAKEELRAEIASMMLGNDLGINREGDDAQHAAYVDSWIKALKDDPAEIFRASADAEKICTYLYEKEKLYEQTLEAHKAVSNENIPVPEIKNDEIREAKERIDDIRKEKQEAIKEPVVTIKFSEHSAFTIGEKMPFSVASERLAVLDKEYTDDPESLGYAKTDFAIDYIYAGQKRHYDGRYDIGDGDGTLLNHIELTNKANIEFLEKRKVASQFAAAPSAEEVAQLTANHMYIQDEFIPYLASHFKISEAEKITQQKLTACKEMLKDPSQEVREMAAGQIEYQKAVLKHLDAQRDFINGCLEQLPESPKEQDYWPGQLQENLKIALREEIIADRKESIMSENNKLTDYLSSFQNRLKNRIIEWNSFRSTKEKFIPTTEAQKAYMLSLGMKFDDAAISFAEAYKALNECVKKIEAKNVDPKAPINNEQKAVLEKNNIAIKDNMTNGEFRKIIGKLPPTPEQMKYLEEFKVVYNKKITFAMAMDDIECLRKAIERYDLPMTDKQRDMLIRHGQTVANDMTVGEADMAIDNMPATEKQIAYLKRHNFEKQLEFLDINGIKYDKENLRYGTARMLIQQEKERIEAIRNEPATKEQLNYLTKNKIKHEDNLTKGQASDLIRAQKMEALKVTEKQLELIKKYDLELPDGADRKMASQMITVAMRTEAIESFTVPAERKMTLSEGYLALAKQQLASGKNIDDKVIAAELLKDGHSADDVKKVIFKHSPSNSYAHAMDKVQEALKMPSVAKKIKEAGRNM